MVLEGTNFDFLLVLGQVKSCQTAGRLHFLVAAGIAYVGIFVYLLLRKRGYTTAERLLYAPVYFLTNLVAG